VRKGLVLQQIFYPQSSTIAGLALKFRLPAIGWQKAIRRGGRA